VKVPACIVKTKRTRQLLGNASRPLSDELVHRFIQIREDKMKKSVRTTVIASALLSSRSSADDETDVAREAKVFSTVGPGTCAALEVTPRSQATSLTVRTDVVLIHLRLYSIVRRRRYKLGSPDFRWRY
jgi:hypothetical protein